MIQYHGSGCDELVCDKANEGYVGSTTVAVEVPKLSHSALLPRESQPVKLFSILNNQIPLGITPCQQG